MATTTPPRATTRRPGDSPQPGRPTRDPRLKVALAAIGVLLVVIILLLVQSLGSGDPDTPAGPAGDDQTEQPADDPYATEPGVVATKRLLEDMVTSGTIPNTVLDDSGFCYTPMGDPPEWAKNTIDCFGANAEDVFTSEELSDYLVKCYTLDGTIQPDTLVVDESVNPDLWFKDEGDVMAYGFGFTIETTDGETVIGSIVAHLMTDTGKIRLEALYYGEDAKPVGS